MYSELLIKLLLLLSYSTSFSHCIASYFVISVSGLQRVQTQVINLDRNSIMCHENSIGGKWIVFPSLII